jgi:acetylornithine deacetylase/succinyl-diaminopimelate desuccinylase-like protein
MRLPVLLAAILLSSAVPNLSAQTSDLDPRIQKLVAAVSQERLEQLLRKLQSFETRNTMSSADSPTRGIGAARQWIFDEMKNSSSRLQVSFDTYQLPKQGQRILRDVELRNVMAVLPGKSPRRIYVSGHYDSLARDPKATRPGFDWLNADNFAPGANDDGSGTVLTMELARVFGESGIDFDATLVFIALAGEEQGLIGAKAHAQKAAAENVVIDAVLNNDMVGNSQGGGGSNDSETVRVFADGPEDSPSRQIARYVRRWAARYYPQQRVELIARHDRFGRGGDHTAFNENGYPGVRITEANENYSRQHSVEDTVEGVDFAYLARNARVNAAVAAVMALAPAAPGVQRAPSVRTTASNAAAARGQVAGTQQSTASSEAPRQGATAPIQGPMLGRQPSGYDARLQWQASPGAVGYRIFWRRAWTPDWEHEVTVGNVTEYVMPNVSIDDYVFGVAALDAAGHESLVSAYVNPPRREERVIVK